MRRNAEVLVGLESVEQHFQSDQFVHDAPERPQIDSEIVLASQDQLGCSEIINTSWLKSLISFYRSVFECINDSLLFCRLRYWHRIWM